MPELRLLAEFAAGFVFGLGLVVSGMVDPAKVLSFLDLAGAWDPSLAFVMAAAVAVTFVGYRIALVQPRPVLAPQFSAPLPRRIDARTLVGAAVFGVGWGLAGYCPGPALVSLATGSSAVLAFVVAMAAGMAIERLATPRARGETSEQTAE